MMKETLSFYWIFGTLVKTLLLACQAKSRQPSSCCLHIRVECRLKCKFLAENEMLSVTLQPDIFKLMIDHQFGITSRRSFLILSSVIICLKSWITNIEFRADIGAYGLFVSRINAYRHIWRIQLPHVQNFLPRGTINTIRISTKKVFFIFEMNS